MKINTDFTKDKYWNLKDSNGDEKINTLKIANKLSDELFISSDLLSEEVIDVLVQTLRIYTNKYNEASMSENLDGIARKLLKKYFPNN